ncbi:SigB/SigF/SigG family RNA polymerase sigma factor [Glycomyces buryatensis]|uniref:SigB/SigF/SigG family RNA polymerase sigma factor n=1 Tax=Glycomyces buryatensis TaxID=2570927 RepID=A0A4S8QCL2_9ACTN|nr:SigB/SigF/SigG family RNA polymerase sigma factor [Glycomyces buryatensis]THV42040.1 SigB/SigF/SigG family RNA polymerase sigma factor [Glycomyces buryatensis]
MIDTSAHSRRSEPDEYAHLRPLLEDLAQLEPYDPKRSVIRDRLVTGYLPLAQHIAQRFSGKGIAKEDLVQVASVGLIHAIDRFDPRNGAAFLSFAVPTVMGEVKRHFRDSAWPMRVPRRLQELRLSLNQASAELAHRRSRPPTDAELAEYLDISEREVQEGFEARQAYLAVSIDEPPSGHEDRAPLSETMGCEDAALESVENHETLVLLLQDLPQRARVILALRFFGEMTQSQIARKVGISQMQVSRLLNHILNDLHHELVDVPERSEDVVGGRR